MPRYTGGRNGFATLLFFLSVFAEAGESPFLHQQKQQKALEQRLAPKSPDNVLSPRASSFSRIQFPRETPCFHIDQVVLEGHDGMPRWLPLQRLANQALGRCLGGQGINLLMSQLQNRMIDHGYVTSRVLAPSQDLKSGTLRLRVVPGTTRQVRLSDDSGRQLSARHPLVRRDARAGGVLGRSHGARQNPAVQPSAQRAVSVGGRAVPLQRALSAPDQQQAADAAGSVRHRQPLDGARL